jgi:hypothetical protein
MASKAAHNSAKIATPIPSMTSHDMTMISVVSSRRLTAVSIASRISIACKKLGQPHQSFVKTRPAPLRGHKLENNLVRPRSQRGIKFRFADIKISSISRGMAGHSHRLDRSAVLPGDWAARRKRPMHTP